MKKVIIPIVAFSFLLLLGAGCSKIISTDSIVENENNIIEEYNEEKEIIDKISYKSITPEKLVEMQKNKDFTLIDVHIPEQKHIIGTDAFIPYNTIVKSEMLPKDKNAKIVLYCRSGSMSRQAVNSLIKEGYTNVYDLVGGKNAYDKFIE